MKKMRLLETFEGNAAVLTDDAKSLKENAESSLIDGQYIIGMIEGQFFQPDGMSRNNRWYSRELWENVLNSADVKNRLLNHTMFGEIGHSDGPVTDMTLRNGEASHIITHLWIDEKGRGMGRAYILNTPAGRNLKTYLGATSKLKVSTRGEGVYLQGQYHDGHPIIDPDTYELQTVDFVLNPGFLETTANLTAQKESVETEKEIQTVNETIAQAKKEGEKRMSFDLDAYVAELKEELKNAKAEVKSLREELNAKDKQLLEKQFVESAEIKKINEEFAPYKKMGVSAKTLNDTLKRSQKGLKEAIAEKAKLSEELQQFKDRCGSIEQIEEATKLSERALNKISEYQKLGSVEQLTKLVEQSEKMLPKLQELSVLTEYRKLGSLDEIKALSENVSNMIPSIKVLEDYKKLGSVEELKEMAKHAEVALNQLKEAKELGNTVKHLIPQLQKQKQIQEYLKKANSVIKQYVETVGSLKKARALAESKKETIKKVNVKEALDVSKKFGCTVESAAKLIKKYGSEKANTLLETAVAKRKSSKSVQLAESKQLIEEVAQMDKVNAKPEDKTAADYLKSGMIQNAFNIEALGKPIVGVCLDDLNGEKVDGLNKAAELLKAYKDTVEVAEAPKVDVEPEKSAQEAEKEADKVLKKIEGEI